MGSFFTEVLNLEISEKCLDKNQRTSVETETIYKWKFIKINIYKTPERPLISSLKSKISIPGIPLPMKHPELCDRRQRKTRWKYLDKMLHCSEEENDFKNSSGNILPKECSPCVFVLYYVLPGVS